MKISKTVDFTKLIKEKENSYTFNPSIALWKDNMYLCCYRNFIRYETVNNKNYNFNPLLDPNHPWLGGEKAFTFWNTVDGSDGTGFFIMEYNDSQILNVKSLNDGNSIYEAIYNDKTKDFVINKTNYVKLNAVDSRLVHLQNDYFLLTYNKYIKNRNLKLKNITCEDGCFIIAARILKLENNGNLILYKENILCPNISNKIEKNWSFWTYSPGKLFFSYGISSKHNIYAASIFPETGDVGCFPIPIVENIGYYGELEKFYNSFFEEKNFLFISVSTPSILNNNGKLIGVGHVKYKNNANMIQKTKGTPLEKFYNQTRNFKRHPVYDYLMFIYEFDKETAAITRITDMFLPKNTDYILSFPSGLSYNSNNTIISYGDHDSLCKLLVIKNDFIESILKPVQIGKDGKIYYPTPYNINFGFFPDYS